MVSVLFVQMIESDRGEGLGPGISGGGVCASASVKFLMILFGAVLNFSSCVNGARWLG